MNTTATQANAERYTLIMLNEQGASEETKHATKSAVRAQIRTWNARKMTARVFDKTTGASLYDGPALGY